MRIRYFGRSAFLIEDLLIDPYISGNRSCEIAPEDISCRIVCVTHSHPDHLGDAFEIAKRNDAVLVAIFEIAEKAEETGVRTEPMNIGGEISIGDWQIKMVEAVHSADMGSPTGFILKNRKAGRTFYHAGDTGLFAGMSLIGGEDIDIAMLPIGGRYTMGIDDALRAVHLIKPKMVIPMHYDAPTGLNIDPQEFKRKCMKPVEIFRFNEEKEI